MMPNHQYQENEILPELEVYLKRFNFIVDPLLKSNLAISFKYVTYLLTQFKDENRSGVLKYSLAKDIIEGTASIVEALAHYWLEQEIANGNIELKKAFPRRYEYKYVKDIAIDEDGDKLVICRKLPMQLTPNNELNFIDLNRAMERTKLIPERLFKSLEELRKKRNMIHLKGLKDEIENLFEDDDLEKAFTVAKELIQRIEASS